MNYFTPMSVVTVDNGKSQFIIESVGRDRTEMQSRPVAFEEWGDIVAGGGAYTFKATVPGSVLPTAGVAATEQWNFRVSVMRHQGKVYRFIFAAKFDSPQFARGAEQTLRSFREATDAMVKAYYEKSAQLFQIPEQVKAEYEEEAAFISSFKQMFSGKKKPGGKGR